MKYRLYFRMLRLMDANLDRLSEGLRVLEDVARFILGDIQITESLKRMRHEFTTMDPALKNSLLAARDAGGDVGRENSVAGIPRKHLLDLVTANAKRVQESLRVLEEFAKLPQMPAEVAEQNFEKARFTLYEIEKELTLRLSRQDKREKIDGLYVVIDAETLTGRSMAEVTREVIRGGARIIQFRNKHPNKRYLIAMASELRQICAKANALFIVNDYVEVAMASDADGIHLGQEDIPVSIAREMMPPDKIIGCSARTVERAIQAQEEGADYIGAGSIYPSPTKSNAEIIGLEQLQEIRSAVSLPIVAIGGINEDNADAVLRHGANSIAVISAVLNSKDIEDSTHRLVTKISERGLK